MTNTILFVTHRKRQCGVYEFGQSIFNAISGSDKFRFVKAECESLEELKSNISEHSPAAIIYNYHPAVLPWLCDKVSKGLYRNNISGIKPVQLGIIHEVTQGVADNATAYRNKYIIGRPEKKLNALFDFYIAPDPTLLLKNPLVFKTGRLVPDYTNSMGAGSEIVIGSFGFGTPGKGFETLVEKVQEEFEKAHIRLNIPFSSFVDPRGEEAIKIANRCKDLVTKPGITIDVSHEYLSETALLNFLAGNTLNAFLYQSKSGRGLSSAVDIALAVERPVAVSDSPMFRHIHLAKPSVSITDNSLQTIIDNGFAPLRPLAEEWNTENLTWEYTRILNRVLGKKESLNNNSITRFIKRTRNKLFTLPDSSFTWLRNTRAANDDDLTINTSLTYVPVTLPKEFNFNRILDDSARAIYEPAVNKLNEIVPVTMAKKISRANVQQGFVFDTVYRNLDKYNDPKLLCVGSYEDTASMSLIKMGRKVVEIDPMVNYFLQEYYTKPTTPKNHFDIIFSTSVIEHDPDDRSFIECIEGLLAPGGLAVITCDYKDGWKYGDPKPDVDERFYNKEDLEKRLPSYLRNSEVVDSGKWACPDPDFNYLGKFQYTFATFVFRKKL